MNSPQDIMRIARTNALSRACRRKHGKAWDEVMSISLPLRLHVQNHPNYVGKRPTP